VTEQDERDKEIAKRVAARAKEADEAKEKPTELQRFADEILTTYDLSKVADFSQDVVRRAFTASGGQCECDRKTCNEKHRGRCPRKLLWENRGHKPDAWQAHHWVAQDRGGTDNLRNCQILCVPCHESTQSYGRPPKV
jgi:hypothetical protein